MSKYYTPTIDEFHMGFEYEWSEKGRKIWIEEKADIDDISLTYSAWEHSDEFKDEYRVKHLDKEDIESFGFGNMKKAVCNWYEMVGHFPDVFATYGYWNKIRLIHCYNGTIKIIAFEYNATVDEYVLFQGKCKNKSEFGKILKQLGLYEQ